MPKAVYRLPALLPQAGCDGPACRKQRTRRSHGGRGADRPYGLPVTLPETPDRRSWMDERYDSDSGRAREPCCQAKAQVPLTVAGPERASTKIHLKVDLDGDHLVLAQRGRDERAGK